MDTKMLNTIIKENVSLMRRKNADYGNANLVMTGVPGIAVRMLDKVHRLYHLTSSGKSANFESINDTIQDIANYAMLAQLLQRGGLTLEHSTLPVKKNKPAKKSPTKVKA